MKQIVIDDYPFKYYRWVDGEYGFREPPYSALRSFLVNKYKICYFCGIPVKLNAPVYKEKNKPDMATIEHLIPRSHSKHKGRSRYTVSKKVLCCYKCNENRNKLFQKGKLKP